MVLGDLIFRSLWGVWDPKAQSLGLQQLASSALASPGCSPRRRRQLRRNRWPAKTSIWELLLPGPQKVCKILAFVPFIMGLGQLFNILSGFR